MTLNLSYFALQVPLPTCRRYYEPTMAYLQTHGAGSLDPQYIDMSDYANLDQVPQPPSVLSHRVEKEPYDLREYKDPTIIDDNLEESDDISNVLREDRGAFEDGTNPFIKGR